MDFEDIERSWLVRQHELVEFEIERGDGWKLRLRKASATFQVLPPQTAAGPCP